MNDRCLWPRVQITVSEDTIPEGYGISVFETNARAFHIHCYKKEPCAAVSISEPVAFFAFPENHPSNPEPF